jgi:YYY domain-containing protein
LGRQSAPPSLLLSPASAAANAQTPPLGAQFSDGLASQAPVIVWLLALEFLGIAVFPLAFSTFAGLHDRGWGLSKLLGLLLLGYLVWLPASVHLLPFDRWVVVAVCALLAAGGAAVAWVRQREIGVFIRARWRLLLIAEGGFLAAFAFMALIRALDPNLWYVGYTGEKPFDLALINGILRSRDLPPLDPWFSGGYINYYYYGQYLVAVLIKLTGIASPTAFNLALAMLFALTFSGAFSIATGLTRSWRVGIAAGAGFVLVCNLVGAGMLARQLRAQLVGQPVPWFDYPRSSQVIPYTLNEYPYWSFLFGDLHAHVIDLPVTLLVVAACASLVLSARAEGRLRWRLALPILGTVALALGAAWCISTWDVPTYAALFALSAALVALPTASGLRVALRSAAWYRRMATAMLAIIGTLAAAYVLYLPFHEHYRAFISGIGDAHGTTTVFQFAKLFAVWLFLALTLYAIDAYAWWRETAQRRRWPPAVVWAGPPLAILALGVAALAGFKSLLAVLLVAGCGLAWRARGEPVKLFAHILLLFAFALALGVEFVYIRDAANGTLFFRLNTVFKFYMQIWTCLALGSVLGLSTFVGGFRRRARLGAEMRAPGARSVLASGLRLGWLLSFVALLAASLVFLGAGTVDRVADPQRWAALVAPPAGIQPDGLSLDGMAYMRGWFPGDYDAITWMNAHVAGAPTIVEASNTLSYGWGGRVAAYTGLPSVLGWAHHQEMQRPPDEVGARLRDVQTFWSTDDPAAAQRFLRRYDVGYVYVGPLERTCYNDYAADLCRAMSPAALAKFDALERAGILRVAYANSDVTIYQVAA